VADRLSFRVFVGLSLEHDIPDHTTLCRFRTMLVARSLAKARPSSARSWPRDDREPYGEN
jgi:IS5 family transposase